MPDLPSHPPGSGPPARRVSSTELEAVIRRATELQFARGDIDDGLPEAEVMRIGKELGLEPAHVRRAIAEVRGVPVAESGMLARVMGPETIRASRVVRRPAAELGMRIEEYLVSCEFMVVERRFPDRTRYARGTGVAASVGRAMGKLGSKHAALDLAHLDVHVSPMDEDSALVELSVPMGTTRGGLAAGGVLGGGGAGAALGTVLAIAGPDPFALVGFPVLGLSVLAARAIYRSVSGGVSDRIEAFLDRVEHGELRQPPRKPDWRRQLGI